MIVTARVAFALLFLIELEEQKGWFCGFAEIYLRVVAAFNNSEMGFCHGLFISSLNFRKRSSNE